MYDFIKKIKKLNNDNNEKIVKVKFFFKWLKIE